MKVEVKEVSLKAAVVYLENKKELNFLIRAVRSAYNAADFLSEEEVFFSKLEYQLQSIEDQI